ncbi:MAG TPA: hypothetical protein VJ302_25175 [Blastocatellia bacterium]|nr:hypothetical protein [Blastocatellia bacterium]
MFCPQCGVDQNQELKFCKKCGANLQAVRQALSSREPQPPATPDWGKSWAAFLSATAAQRREDEMEQYRGIMPEVNRYREIKAGVITTSVGLAVMICLHFLAQGLIVGGTVATSTGEILSSLWVAGMIPFLVGIGLMVNGLLVSKKLAESVERKMRFNREQQLEFDKSTAPLFPGSADPAESTPADFSIVDETTRHLGRSGPEQ